MAALYKSNMEQTKNWFEVSKEGLKELQSGKPKHFILRELVQNAWDEDISVCQVNLNYTNGLSEISVLDDNPEGFKDLRDSYTLFRTTIKRSNPNQRGRFNIGEKQAIALSQKAEIITTKGSVRFDKKGRHHSKKKLKQGSRITLWVKMTIKEYTEIFTNLERYLVPKKIKFSVSGYSKMGVYSNTNYHYRKPDKITEASLETEILENDQLKRVWRKTKIHTLKKWDDQAWLYELGLPVCEIDCK